MSEAVGIKVAVRVRPFNQREKDMKSPCVLVRDHLKKNSLKKRGKWEQLARKRKKTERFEKVS